MQCIAFNGNEAQARLKSVPALRQDPAGRQQTIKSSIDWPQYSVHICICLCICIYSIAICTCICKNCKSNTVIGRTWVPRWQCEISHWLNPIQSQAIGTQHTTEFAAHEFRGTSITRPINVNANWFGIGSSNLEPIWMMSNVSCTAVWVLV